MNLFLAGWNLPSDYRSRSLVELQRMGEVYPLLDLNTIWSFSSKTGSVFVASMYTDDQVAAPRQYVNKSDNQVVFYSGLPVNSTGNFLAHRSEALSLCWDQLTENIEGMFCIVRAADNPSSLELQTDIVGMEQVFYYHQGDLWLISNSVRLIANIVRNVSLDPLGISLYTIMGYVGDDRTLLSTIRVIPGGEKWTWKEGDREPKQQSYYKPSRFARLPGKSLTSDYFHRLTEDLSGNLRILDQCFDKIQCSLTGGRDSRLVAALLIHAGLKAQYYTMGEQFGTDEKIAKQIANAFDLNYRLIRLTGTELMKNWDTSYQQLVLQGDGMGTVELIPAILASQALYSNNLNVDLGGTGGEIARGGIDDDPDLRLFSGQHDMASMQMYLSNKNVYDYNGFIHQEGVELGRDYIYRFVARFLDEGFAPIDIPHVFFFHSRVRRKRGNNKRVQMQYQDFFTPYITRAYIEAAFAISTLGRYSEPIHYNIIRLLPKLHEIPFDRGPWPYQNPTLNLSYRYYQEYREKILSSGLRRFLKTLIPGRKLKKVTYKPHYATDMFDQTGWFEHKRQQMREFCLDRKDSPIWDIVDRSIFEKVSSPSVNPAELAQYGPYITIFFRIANLFYYENSLGNHFKTT